MFGTENVWVSDCTQQVGCHGLAPRQAGPSRTPFLSQLSSSLPCKTAAEPNISTGYTPDAH